MVQIAGMFKTLDRYCYFEFMVMLLVGTTLPAGLLFFTDKIKDLQSYMKDFGCPFDLYILMTTMQLPDIIVHCLPAGVLIATILVLYRMMSDSEIVALQSSGVSLLRIFQPFLVLGITVGLFSFLVNELVVPRSLKMSTKLALLAASRGDLPEAQGVHDFKGMRKDENGNVSEVYLVGSRKGNNLTNTLLFKFDQEKNVKLLYAPEGLFKGAGWLLFNGHEYDLSAVNSKGLPSIINTNFSKMAISPPDLMAKFDPDKREPEPSEMNTVQLIDKIVSLKKQGKEVPVEHQLNLNYNLASPLTCLFIVIAAFPIGLLGRRRHKTAIGLSYGGFLLFFYFTFEQITWALARNGFLSPTVAVWTPGIVIAASGLALTLWLSKK